MILKGEYIRMKYSDNITIQKFIEQLVDVLKYENEYREPNSEKLNIPFIIAKKRKKIFNNYKQYNNYCIRKVNVFLYNKSENNNLECCVEESDFKYEITLSYDERNCGYCECSPGDPDYREDKHCCGHGCDWEAPSVEVRKSFLVSNHSWHGDEHDYWDFEDKFYANDKEENEKKLLAEREYKIKNLKETIENAQKELKKLENL